MRCNGCGSKNTIKHGTYRNRKGEYQIYKCKNCGRTHKGKKLR